MLRIVSAAEDLDLLEPVVDGAIDGLHCDLHPGRRHWLRQADDVPVPIPLKFVDGYFFTNFLPLRWKPRCLRPARAGVQRDLLVCLHRIVSL